MVTYRLDLGSARARAQETKAQILQKQAELAYLVGKQPELDSDVQRLEQKLKQTEQKVDYQDLRMQELTSIIAKKERIIEGRVRVLQTFPNVFTSLVQNGGGEQKVLTKGLIFHPSAAWLEKRIHAKFKCAGAYFFLKMLGVKTWRCTSCGQKKQWKRFPVGKQPLPEDSPYEIRYSECRECHELRLKPSSPTVWLVSEPDNGKNESEVAVGEPKNEKYESEISLVSQPTASMLVDCTIQKKDV